uniref:Uncharacterized protein n=1 Tax=Heterorhabditis bacteriophora TaxID=37862 RepID=A0A1I7WI32_HETBA
MKLNDHLTKYRTDLTICTIYVSIYSLTPNQGIHRHLGPLG